MATIVSIKQKIEQLDSGSFQILCDEYLSRKGYPNLVSLGTRSGTQKTTLGTPDTYFCKINGKYVFAEYTTQKTNLKEKIRSDLEKCFDTHSTGIRNEDIVEIIYCHTSSNINVSTDKTLKQYCQEKGTQLTLIGIDRLSEDIYRNYPILAKEHLDLVVDTEQIQQPYDFIKQYDANTLVAPLNTKFQFRENEFTRLQQEFVEHDIVLLTGAAGAGKTRLALEFAERYKKEHKAMVYIIHNHGLPIYEDLKLYFESPGNYFIVIDDANQISQLDLIIEYVNKKVDGYNVKILITVRNYASRKVKLDILGIARYSEVILNSLSDDEIQSLVKNYWGIVNQDYLNRIVTIAEGNARIAVIAGKIASDANRLQSISDVTGLYAEYYGKAFRDANLENNLQLQITAGIIAFLGSIHLDHIEPVLDILDVIDLMTFHSCIYKLHEMELVDICRDKAVAISDQCFANFILKHVFIDKKAISLAEMLDTCFQIYRERTIQAVNTLIGVFQSPEVINFTEHEIKVVWKKRKNESFPRYWEWVKVFYPINQEEALLLIKEQIDKIEKVNISISDIDISNGKNYQSVDDELIRILGGYADTENLDSALDLFFEYYLKRSDLYIQFYHAINLYFGIKTSSVKNGFFTQVQLINHFHKYSNGWNNPFITLLFFEIVKNLLQVQFSPSKPDRHGHGIIIYYFSLPTTEQVIEYRKLIWEQILLIQSTNDSKKYIRAILQDYAGAVEETSYGIIMEDAPYICKLFQIAFSPDLVNDCILAERIDSILNLVGYNSENIVPFLRSRKLEIYHLLVGPKWKAKIDYTERENEKEKIISDFLSLETNRLNAFDELFEVYNECAINNSEHLYEVGNGLMIAIKYLSQYRSQFFKVAKKMIASGLLQAIDINYITATLLTFVSSEEVKQILLSAPKETIDFWLYSYYHEMPLEYIDNAKLEELYAYLKCDYDRNIHTSGYRDLKFLEKYETVDSSVIIKAARLIFEKKKYSPFIVHIYFSFLFNRYIFEPRNVIQKFESDYFLLEEIYLFESLHDRLADCDGAFLKELCIYRKEFAQDYINRILAENQYLFHDKSKELQAIYECPGFIDIIDIMVDECFHATFSNFEASRLMKAFIFVPEDLSSKSDEWIKHYILKNNSELKKMECIFNVISELDDDKKIGYISCLINLNDDPKLFKRIPLCPTSYSWSGSAVPLYSKWIDYLKKLLPLFSGIKFLSHKQTINDEIDRLTKMIEKAEIEDLLRG